MLRRAAALPAKLRLSSQLLIGSRHSYAQEAIQDPKVFKKFIGVEDNLGVGGDARGKLSLALHELLDSLKEVPDNADYMRAVEATTKYRLKVLEENESDQAVEEVLDAHLEELILETREELSLIPLMNCELLSPHAWGGALSGQHSSARQQVCSVQQNRK
eukprot:jgi/Chrzof1/6992/Cz02g06240.t1